MKQLNTPWAVGLLAFLVVYFALHYGTPELSESLLLTYGCILAFLMGAIRYITLPVPSRVSCHPDLPEAAMRALQESLHHSQMTLYFTIIQPMLLRSFPTLVTQIIGKKPNEAPLTRFDEKIEALKHAFRQLAASGCLYNKRAMEDRDRALTMLVFLRILWRELPASELPARLKTIPVALYPMLRTEAYRLYDLVLLFTNGQLLANENEFTLLGSLIGFYPTLSHEVATTSGIVTEDAALELYQNTVSTTHDIASIIDAPIVPVEHLLPATDNTGSPDCLPEFLSWLVKRMASGNNQFALESQALLVCNPIQHGVNTLFLLPDVFAKYQSRSGVQSSCLERALQDAFSESKTFFIERDAQRIVVLPCILNEPFSTDYSTVILEGVPA